MFKALKSLLLVAVLVIMAAKPAFSVDGVVIKGSTTVLPIAQAAVDAYMKLHPGVQLSLSGGGSGDGIKALIDSSTDIANSSRESGNCLESAVSWLAGTPLTVKAFTPFLT